MQRIRLFQTNNELMKLTGMATKEELRMNDFPTDFLFGFRSITEFEKRYFDDDDMLHIEPKKYPIYCDVILRGITCVTGNDPTHIEYNGYHYYLW